MYSPHRAASRMGNIGQPLPGVFKQLSDNRATFRRGATSLIAGTPASFKSVIALNMLTRWADQDVKSLYFAADSDEATVITRLGGILTNQSFETVERRMTEGQDAQYYDAFASRLAGRAEFEYEHMDFDGLVRHVKSFEVAYGAYPDVVFIDNLVDFVDRPDDYGGMIEVIREADGLAKEIKAHVCILHHAKLRDNKGEGDDERDPMQPPADWEVVGRITQIPRLVLTICERNMKVNMSVVRNTHGPQSKDASVKYGFEIYGSMRVAEVAAINAYATV
jgi:KaiC/GvpD/RAD55 family RecA-like ATPase